MCLDRTIAPLHALLQRARSLSQMSHAYTLLGIFCAVLLFGLAACEREGPMEKAGRSVDRAAKDMRDAVKK
jgi:hypothetical protein